MANFDFSPLYRTVVGFDRLARLADAAMMQETNITSYPPYNIEASGDNDYRITLAVAGFAEADLEIQVVENTLTVTGKRAQPNEDKKYLYHGIAGRDFTRRFELADHVKVIGANLDSGLLTIDLVRELPEAMKPRKIEIAAGKAESLFDKGKKLLGKVSDHQHAA
jgi:molecular chaperone IbpA